ncbi:hypothetical protein [Spirosoma sordidisoli]|uniref:Uncharacterized protein n=1 Tax=Spirosoma sordidisoli TaxID=2502893 RepID=A0A4Q2UDN9_9BACT|nr:hypothetical protein [Spirosoma sordidisoli]RYC66956.1 hypothetical protein EQG79_26635 [Spirosoma sordidisoli]
MTDQDYRNKIIQMLGVLDVKDIYYIDDELKPSEIDENEVVQRLLNADALQREAASAFVPIEVLNVPPTLRQRALTEFLAQQGVEEREEIVRKTADLLHIKSQPVLNDQARFLQELFLANRQGITVHCLGPKEWQEKEELVIKAATPSSRLFCLFDQNLGGPGHLGSGASLTGLSLIRSSLELDGNRELVFCVLFTGDITGEVLTDSELDYWSRSTADAGLASSQFFPLSKDRTLSRRSFAEGIKLSALNALYDVLRQKTVRLLNEATSTAQRELNAIHLYNLDFMVSTTSVKEGVWEASTLMRLHEILRQEQVKDKMVKEDFAIFFNKNIGKVSQINKLLKYVPEIPVEERYRLRRQELFEIKSLNEIHSELRTGDIFRATLPDGVQDFVLLAQPCDLIVRQNGKRKSVVVTMAPIRTFTNQEEYDGHLRKEKSYDKTVWKLDSYPADAAGLAFVELNSLVSVEVRVLDLAVLSKNGNCTLYFSADTQCPEELQSTWQKRFSHLYEDLHQVNQTALSIKTISDSMPAGKDKDLILSLLPTPFKNLSTNPTYRLPAPQYSTDSISYNMHRVCNIRIPLSTHLLDIYTKYLSRTAFEHDFASSEA